MRWHNANARAGGRLVAMAMSSFDAGAASVIELGGLQSESMNGLVGICTGELNERGRLPVEVYVDRTNVKGIMVKPENVRKPAAAQGTPSAAEFTLRKLHNTVSGAGSKTSPEVQSAKLRVADAFDFVVSTMREHKSDFAVIDVAIRLANLCTAALLSESIQSAIFRKFVASGLCQAVADAMRQFPSAGESGIHHAALSLFQTVIGGAQSTASEEQKSLAKAMRAAAKDVDVLGLVRGALETHQNAEEGDADVVHAALAVLAQWTRPGSGGGEAALNEVLDAGLAPLIVSVMRVHGAGEPAVATSGLRCITHMLDMWIVPPLPAAARCCTELGAVGAHEVVMRLGNVYPEGHKIAGGPSADDLEAVTAKFEEMLRDEDDD